MDRFYTVIQQRIQRKLFTTHIRFALCLSVLLALSTLTTFTIAYGQQTTQQIQVPPKYTHTYTPLPKLPADPPAPEALPWYKRLFSKKKPVKVDSSKALEVGPRAYPPSRGLMVRVMWPICLNTPQGQQKINPGIYLGNVDWPPAPINTPSGIRSPSSTQAGQLSLMQHGHIFGAVSLPHQQPTQQTGYPTPEAMVQSVNKTTSPQLHLNQGTSGQLFFSVTQPDAKLKWMSNDVRCPSGLAL